MNCDFCKTKNLTGKFCSECGNPLSKPVESCQFCGNPELVGKFCHECGKPVQGNLACPECNAPDQSGRFCKVCGCSINIENPTETLLAQQEFELLLEGDFDRGTVWCKACGGKSARFRQPGVTVEYCTLCASGAAYLDF